MCNNCNETKRINKRKTTEEFTEQAKKVHGEKYEYNNTVYVYAREKVIITCKIHGDFQQTPDAHLHGYGCKKCANEKTSIRCKKTTEEFIKEAKKVHQNTYTYDFADYTGTSNKITITCKIHGNFVLNSYSHLIGYGCPKCSLRTPAISKDEFLNFANEKFNDKFVYNLNTFVNMSTKLLIQCPVHGDFFQTPWAHLSSKYGCVKCYYKQEQQIQKLKQIVESYGGEVLGEYKNIDTPIEFKDTLGNVFFTTPYSVLSGKWSPHSSKLVSENICRQIFQYIFDGYNFASSWRIVTKENSRNYQLDGYEENVLIDGKKYKIAFEYQGSQAHREDPATIERDLYKQKFCRENDIILFVVDKFPEKQRYDSGSVFELVFNKIKKIFPGISLNKEPFKIDFTRITNSVNSYNKWKEFGENHGYELLSVEFKHQNLQLKWKNKKTGFIFYRSPNTILAKGWPSENSPKISHSLSPQQQLDILKNIAIQHGGEILSSKWNSHRDFKFAFKDVSGNVFEAKANHTKNGHWSPYESNHHKASRKIIDNQIHITTKKGDLIVYEQLDKKTRRIVRFNDIFYDWTTFPYDGLKS